MPQTVRTLTLAISDLLAQVLRPLDQRWFEAELLVSHVLKQDRTWIALHPTQTVTNSQVKNGLALAHRRASHEPLAYLLDQAPFCGHLFFVDQRVLIPRPESEWLVETSHRAIGNGQDWAVWDVGTGSGCLALSIGHAVPQAEVLGSDCSRSALQVALKNKKRLGLQNVSFTAGSLLSPAIKRWLKQQIDKRWLIVANLPYLPTSDRSKLQKQVVDHEPNTALFAEDAGLALIKELLNQLQTFIHQRKSDLILLEHDPRQARNMLSFTKKLFPLAKTSSELDQNGAKRFTKINFTD
jgi:release factor glutamine methyltransferase